MENQVQPAEEAPEVSVEDRAANIFEDGPSESPEAAQEATEPVEETFEFEVEGEKFVLPKKLEKAVLQERDYTQKTQTLAEQRKDVDRQLSQIKLMQSEKAFNDSIREEVSRIEMIGAVLEEYGKLNWSQMGTDEMFRKKLEIDQYKELKAGIESSVQAKRAQFDQTMSQELERIKAEAKDTLTKRLNWNEETDKETRAYAREIGYTDAEYDAVYDPRAKQMAWEAAQYRKLKAGAQPAVKQAKAVRANPSNPMPEAVKNKLKFSKELAKTKPGTSERRKVVEARAMQIFS